MKLGCCTSISQYHVMETIGYDFIELAGSAVYDMSDTAYMEAKRIILNGRMYCQGFNALIKPEIKIVGNHKDTGLIDSYMDKVVERAVGLGVKHLGLGSPLSRTVSGIDSKERAVDEFCEFIDKTLKKIAGTDIYLLIEPINSNETNFINNIPEAMTILRKVNHNKVGLVVDIYHFLLERENLDKLDSEVGRHLKHVHIADPDGRHFPRADKISIYHSILSRMKNIGYSDGVSIEGKHNDFLADAGESFSLLKSLTKL